MLCVFVLQTLIIKTSMIMYSTCQFYYRKHLPYGNSHIVTHTLYMYNMYMYIHHAQCRRRNKGSREASAPSLFTVYADCSVEVRSASDIQKNMYMCNYVHVHVCTQYYMYLKNCAQALFESVIASLSVQYYVMTIYLVATVLVFCFCKF